MLYRETSTRPRRRDTQIKGAPGIATFWDAGAMLSRSLGVPTVGAQGAMPTPSHPGTSMTTTASLTGFICSSSSTAPNLSGWVVRTCAA